MSMQEKTSQLHLLTPSVRQEIDHWVAKYPAEQKQSAVMAALRIVQENSEGYLSNELMNAVAEYLDMPRIAVYEVATFYSMYEHQPVGRHKICVCNSISCFLNGSQEILDYLEQKLGVKPGEVTADGRFSIKEVECLGACVGAPAVMIGKQYYENVSPDTLDKLLEELD